MKQRGPCGSPTRPGVVLPAAGSHRQSKQPTRSDLQVAQPFRQGHRRRPVQSSHRSPGRRRQSQTTKAWTRGDFRTDFGIKSGGGEVASDSGPSWKTEGTSTGRGAVPASPLPLPALLFRALFSLRCSCRQAELEGLEDSWAGVPPDPQIIHILLENRRV